jgi:hypothetical protein
MTCRDEILMAVKSIIRSSGINQFTIVDVLAYMKCRNSKYEESTIKTHISSRCCTNAPTNHAVTYKDFERIAHGLYRLI